jgi:hypothetical protein
MQKSTPYVFAQESGTGKTVETGRQLPGAKYKNISGI